MKFCHYFQRKKSAGGACQTAAADVMIREVTFCLATDRLADVLSTMQTCGLVHVPGAAGLAGAARGCGVHAVVRLVFSYLFSASPDAFLCEVAKPAISIVLFAFLQRCCRIGGWVCATCCSTICGQLAWGRCCLAFWALAWQGLAPGRPGSHRTSLLSGVIK